MSVHFGVAGAQLEYVGGAPDKTAITLSYWSYRTANLSAIMTHVRFRDSSDTTVWVSGSSSSGNFPQITSIGGSEFDLSQQLADNCWTWYGVTVSGTTLQYFYQVSQGNPVYGHSGTASGGGANAKYSIGGRGTGDATTEPFRGRIAAVKLWNGVLTKDELLREQAQVLPVRSAGLFAAYSLDNITDGVRDLSGQGRTLAVAGGPVTIPDGPPIPRQRIIVRPWLSSPAGAGSVTGTAAAPLGGLTATVSGTREALGATVTAALGGLTATVAGTVEVTGTVAAPLGALTATAVQSTGPVTGTVAAPLGGLTATVAGTVEVPGVVTSALGVLAATVVGTRATAGSVAVALGALAATVVVPVVTTGRYTIGTPSRNSRDQSGTPSRNARDQLGTPSRATRYTIGAPS